MYLSRIKIQNFRNFSNLDVELAGNIVVVGENRVGKSNLVYALRLVLDPGLPDSARQLNLSDFWDGLDGLSTDDKIVVSLEIKDFETDADILATLTDFRLDEDPSTVRLTYELRPVDGLDQDPATQEDYEFICYGGENEAKRFGHNLRRRITMDVLPALRDAEGDLSAWKRSPLRPLIEEAFKDIDRGDLEEIGKAIEEATAKITEFDEINSLEENIAELFADMSGPTQDISPKLGFSPTDPTRLYRSVRLLIDDGARGINDASLGSANLVFLSLKTLEIRRLIEENRRDHTFLAIEEPEAHLHPHLQRSVYQHVFETAQQDEGSSPLSILLTTHSPHIASVAPLRSILLLKDGGDKGTIGFSTQEISLSDDEADDIARYLDVTRAEMLFARGVILVEGDAERFLVPAFAEKMGKALDHLGITVCSVSGTNFRPYVKVLNGLGIPCSVITDWDPSDGKKPLGLNRCLNLIQDIQNQLTGQEPTELLEELRALKDYSEFGDRCEEFGIFTNVHTLEIDLFENDFAVPMIGILTEQKFGAQRKALIAKWEGDHDTLDNEAFLAMIETIGKGRFAQRLASNLGEAEPPQYIVNAVDYVTERV